ncbi:MAG: TetR/AcrR family transcriptional regulator [Acidimicrobiales bacterium]
MSPQRRDKDTTRQILLEAAFEMMLEQGLDVGWGVRVADVTKRVGLTTGAAYQIWSGSRTKDGMGGQDRFHHDLALYAMERLISDPALAHNEAASALATDGGSLERMIRTATAGDFELLSDPAEFALYLGLLAATSSMPEIAEVGRASYQRITDDHVELYTKLFDHFGVEMVPPHTVRDLVVSAIALGEGLCLRALVDPDAVPDDHDSPAEVPDDATGPWHLFSIGVLALIRGMTRPRAT